METINNFLKEYLGEPVLPLLGISLLIIGFFVFWFKFLAREEKRKKEIIQKILEECNGDYISFWIKIEKLGISEKEANKYL